MLHAAVFGMFVLALIGGGPWNIRLAMISFAGIYFAGTLLFRVLAIRELIGHEGYLLVAAILSYAQVMLYTRLQPSPGILAAACCEVVLLAIMLLSCLQVDVLMPVRVAFWRSANTVAVGILLWSWANGRLAGNSERDSADKRGSWHRDHVAACGLPGFQEGRGALEKGAVAVEKAA